MQPDKEKNQKLVEEAPAVNADAAVLAAIEETAVKIAQCVGYKNAGTVEFLLSADNRFFSWR